MNASEIPPGKPDSEIDPEWRTTLLTVLPMLQSAAKADKNITALVLLFAQEILMRHDEYEDAGTIAILGTIAMERGPNWELLKIAIDAVAAKDIPEIEARIDEKHAFHASEPLDRAEMVEIIAERFKAKGTSLEQMGVGIARDIARMRAQLKAEEEQNRAVDNDH